jgi:hypothetical protein
MFDGMPGITALVAVNFVLVVALVGWWLCGSAEPTSAKGAIPKATANSISVTDIIIQTSRVTPIPTENQQFCNHPRKMLWQC